MENSSGLSKEIYNAFKISFNLLGFIVTEDTNCKLRIVQQLFICSVYASSFVLSCIGVSNSYNLEASLRHATEACSTGICFFMTCFIVINKDNICHVFAVLHQGIVQHSMQLTEHEKHLKETGHSISKRIAYTMGYAISITVAVRLLVPLCFGCYRLYNGVEVGENLPLPLVLWSPFSSDTPLKYTALYLLSLICVVGMSTLFLGVCLILFTSIIYARYEIKVLAETVMLLEEKAKMLNVETQRFQEEKLYDCLCYSIQHHQQILSFIRLLNKTFGMIIFFMVDLVGVLICFDVYQMSVDQSLFSFSNAYLPVIVFSSFLVLLMLSWLGQSLIDEDNLLRLALYKTKWIDWPDRYKRCLLLMLQRTSHPMCLKIAGIQTLDYNTFVSIMQVAYSYYNILHTVHSNKQIGVVVE